jgi:hypothetical protein
LHSFLLQDESIPGPKCSCKIVSIRNSIDTIRSWTHDLDCSVVCQPTAPLYVSFCVCCIYIYACWLHCVKHWESYLIFTDWMCSDYHLEHYSLHLQHVAQYEGIKTLTTFKRNLLPLPSFINLVSFDLD